MKIISLLRFPMIVGVVFCHSMTFSDGSYPAYDVLRDLITDICSDIPVSLFFFFSGYLFFLNVEEFSFKVYKKKIQRRVFSLLIPYIFWNLFCVAIMGTGAILMPEIFNVARDELSGLDFSGWLSLFYCGLDTNQPVAYQLWFLRDLIVVTLFTPVIYYLCRWLKFWWIILPVVGYVLFVPLFGRFSYMGIAFFSAGCYFGINKRSFTLGSKSLKWLVILLYVVLLIILVMFREDIHDFHKFFRLNNILGAVALIQLVSLYLSSRSDGRLWYMKKSITDSAFFIYCYHGIFATYLSTRTSHTVVHSGLSAMLWSVVTLFTLVAAGVLLFNMLLRIAPRLTGLITGGRSGNS